MKKIKLLCLFLALIALLPSCAKKERDICSLLLELCDIFSEEYGPSVLYSDAEHQGFTKSDGVTLGRLYTGLFEPPNCYSRIKSFAVRLPMDDSGFEIHIIKCVNRSDTEEISALLMRRIDSITSSEIMDYAPESYERYFIGAEVFTRGDTVFLLATPDNAKVKKEIKKLRF